MATVKQGLSLPLDSTNIWTETLAPYIPTFGGNTILLNHVQTMIHATYWQEVLEIPVNVV